ncbi:tetratricopeptide repeat protein [Vallicoccus soli]|uniref:Co-chaperone YbbN n=1 Tax=Vallicoccus soli TaxID=2339232 RepID=A0A3A3ZAR1_9ACTN|nr:tetratricopeptide repeat protein [Vallicoccus soli]RJK98176.1 co-chaperone YbbN [Vallicoccus soli]
MTTPSNFNAYGAVDLSALAARAQAASRPAPAAAGGGAVGGAGAAGAGVVVDVTEATFEAEVIQRSMTVPVVVDLWADWCGPCKQLSPILERLAIADGGRWVLAKVDVDAEQRIGAAFQVQSIPAVYAVLRGQPVPLFQGALPEPQVRQYLDELLRIAAENGVSGTVAPGGAPEAPAEPPSDPRFDAAYDAVERGDWAAARAAYQQVLAQAPADPEAAAGLAQVDLMERTESVDPAAVLAAAGAAPDDVAAQTLAADVELLQGDVEGGFRRLVETVRRSSGADRDAARAHLLSLFNVVGSEDPRVARARTLLANALF